MVATMRNSKPTTVAASAAIEAKLRAIDEARSKTEAELQAAEANREAAMRAADVNAIATANRLKSALSATVADLEDARRFLEADYRAALADEASEQRRVDGEKIEAESRKLAAEFPGIVRELLGTAKTLQRKVVANIEAVQNWNRERADNEEPLATADNLARLVPELAREIVRTKVVALWTDPSTGQALSKAEARHVRPWLDGSPRGKLDGAIVERREFREIEFLPPQRAIMPDPPLDDALRAIVDALHALTIVRVHPDRVPEVEIAPIRDRAEAAE